MKIRVSCDDKYEAQKLASLIFIKDAKETFITSVLNVIENELVVALKDKSAHSVLMKDKEHVEIIVDFLQSIIDKEHRIISTTILEQDVEIIKG
jgi:hypothetical protein